MIAMSLVISVLCPFVNNGEGIGTVDAVSSKENLAAEDPPPVKISLVEGEGAVTEPTSLKPTKPRRASTTAAAAGSVERLSDVFPASQAPVDNIFLEACPPLCFRLRLCVLGPPMPSM